MGSVLVRFAQLGWPWRMLLAQTLVALQAVAVTVAVGRVFRSVTPGLLNRSSLLAGWLNGLAQSQRKSAVFVACQIALATTVSASPLFVDHLRDRRNLALGFLLVLEVLTGLATGPYTTRFVRRRHKDKAPFIVRVSQDLVAGKLAGAFAEVLVGGVALRYPTVGVPALRYAATQTASSLLQPQARRLVAPPPKKASTRRAPPKQRKRVHRCRAKTSDGTLCKNRVTEEGARCHLHRRW